MNGKEWFPDHLVAETFLQPLHRRRDLFAAPIAAGPQPDLAPARAFEHRQLDPQLGDRRARLPFLDPRADEPEQLCRAAQRMADDGFALFRCAWFHDKPDAQVLRAGAANTVR